ARRDGRGGQAREEVRRGLLPMVIALEERADRVVVTLDRPERRNAIDAEMVDALHGVCATLEREPRLLLLTGGADGIFAAGADIAQLRGRGRLGGRPG